MKNVENYLKATYPEESLRVETLLNEEATRAGIIDGFREHLAQASKDDVVLFHYSGHGAQSRSAEEFKQFFNDGHDEGLVCYDSRIENGYDLADKELAVLLSELDQSAHIVCLFDCCHAGSGTRFHSVELFPKARNTNPNKTPRTCLLYTSPSPRDQRGSRMPSSA